MIAPNYLNPLQDIIGFCFYHGFFFDIYKCDDNSVSVFIEITNNKVDDYSWGEKRVYCFEMLWEKLCNDEPELVKMYLDNKYKEFIK